MIIHIQQLTLQSSTVATASNSRHSPIIAIYLANITNATNTSKYETIF